MLELFQKLDFAKHVLGNIISLERIREFLHSDGLVRNLIFRRAARIDVSSVHLTAVRWAYQTRPETPMPTGSN